MNLDMTVKNIRQVATTCPFCFSKIQGSLIQKKDFVVLSRNCYKDGMTELILSHNPLYYSDWDRFYFSILKKGKPRGRVINYWVLSTSKCQTKCNYCQLEVQNPIFQDMNKEDLYKIISENKSAKLTFSGGEPTLSPHVFYFFRSASRLKKHTQLATNGLRIADKDFYQKLKESGLKEVRISYEVLSLKNSSEFDKWANVKLVALKALEKGDFCVSLSPTIFKGLNEDVLLETLEYAKDKKFIKEISVNGFSWVGHGMVRDKKEMIMPDEMMDIICKKFNVENREDIFTFQKAIFLLLQFMNIRVCIYTQIMIFVRKVSNLELITDYFNMNKMKKALKCWEVVNNMPYIIQLIGFFLCMLYSIKLRTLTLTGDILRFVISNISNVDFSKYPHRLLPIVFNTNCSLLSMDEEASKQCMSGVILKKDNKISKMFTTYLLIDKEIRKRKYVNMGK